jgi:molecular chaperone GrpE
MSKKKNECKKCNEKQKEYEKLKKDYILINNQLRLLQADFDNYKKRVIKEKKELSDKSKIELIIELLPSLESLKKASDLSQEDGFKLIYKNLMKDLTKQGLKEIKSVGEKFNINFHEAMVSVIDKSKDDEIIVDEVEKGYMFKDKLVKPSKVIVNKKQ